MQSNMANLTRAALLELIVPLVGREPEISVAQLATRLGVGRTTLYRHFTDRETLLKAVATVAAQRFVVAVGTADPLRGTGAEAIERLCTELFQLPDVLTLLFADNPLVSDDDLRAASSQAGAQADGDVGADPFSLALRRGTADGSVDPAVPVDWAAIYIFLTLASGHLYADSAGVGRQEGLAWVLHALRRTLFT